MRYFALVAASLVCACGGGSNEEEAARNESAEITEIGTLGGKIETVPDLKFGGAGQPRYPAVSVIYEPSNTWALVTVETEDGVYPNRVVDLESGKVRRACDELSGGMISTQIYQEIPDPERQVTNVGWATSAFRVTDDGVLEAIYGDSVVRCQLDDGDSPGTMLESVAIEGDMTLSVAGAATALTDAGVWLGPQILLGYDGTRTEFPWMDLSLWSHARKRDGDGFLAAATDATTGDVVGVEVDLEGNMTELGRNAGGSVAGVSRDAVQITPASGTGCVLMRSGGEVSEVSIRCGGTVTRDGKGYFVDKTWAALDGSAVVEHPQADDWQLTAAGSVVHLENLSTRAVIWTAPIDEPPAAAIASEQYTLQECESCSGSYTFAEFPNGVCFIDRSADGPDFVFAFDCTDAKTTVRLDAKEIISTPTDPQMINGVAPVFRLDVPDPDAKPRPANNIFVMDSKLEKRWVADDRVLTVHPRTTLEGLSFSNALAVGYDGTLYRVDDLGD